MRIKLGAMGLIATALAGCASSSFNIDPITAPQKFQFLRCEDIAKLLVSSQTKERELQGLMDRANGGVGGSAVNVLVYGPDLQILRSELRQLREAAGEKRCSDEILNKAASKTEIPPPR